jgi:hypothetical protein
MHNDHCSNAAGATLRHSWLLAPAIAIVLLAGLA